LGTGRGQTAQFAQFWFDYKWLISEATVEVFVTVADKNFRSKIDSLLKSLDSSHQTYRRLAATQYFSCANGLDQMLPQLVRKLKTAGID